MVLLSLLLACTPPEPPEDVVGVEVFGGLATVEAHVDGRPYHCLVDTGADGVGVRSGLRARNEVFLHDITVQVGQVGVQGLTVYTGHDAFFDAIDASSGFEQPVDCLLGTDVLGRFAVTLDYATGQLQLTTGEPWVPEDTEGAIEIALEQGRPFPLGIGRFDDVVGRVLVDSGAGTSVMRPELFQRLEAPPNMRPATIATADGHQEGHTGDLDNIGIGGTVQDGVAMVSYDSAQLGFIGQRAGVPVEGILGASFLVHYAVTFDLPRKRMILRPYEPIIAARTVGSYRDDLNGKR